jgi:NAD(P)-dependent dehydrogenase (short-subunit alcohol dehydrogenase family)
VGPSVVTFLIEPHADIVRLTVTHENLPGVEMFNGMSSGWPAVLANLKTLLETGVVLSTALWESRRPSRRDPAPIERINHTWSTAMSELLLGGKTAVIYGGGGAIGGAVARVFAREGARVFIAGRTQAKLDAVARDIAAAGGMVETAQVDVLDQEAVEKHADAIAATAGGIDIALNAVSVLHDQGTLLADLSLEEFMRPIDGFLRPLFITSKAVARHLGRERPGVILTLSEPGAKLAAGGILGHGVSAAGKETFARLLAVELAPANIRVIDIRPHAVADAPAAGSYTKDLFEPAAAAAGQSVREFLDRGDMVQGTLLKKLPTLSEIAETAAFLASDRAGSMTGTIVNLTAGALVD